MKIFLIFSIVDSIVSKSSNILLKKKTQSNKQTKTTRCNWYDWKIKNQWKDMIGDIVMSYLLEMIAFIPVFSGFFLKEVRKKSGRFSRDGPMHNYILKKNEGQLD